MKSRKHASAWLIAFVLLWWTGAPMTGRQAATPAPTRVLFIGNSLTTVNDVPRMVEALARAAGDAFECQTVAFNDYSLEDQWNRADARRAIAGGGWSTVILQQGPSALPESQLLLREDTRRFDDEVRRVGARIGLYMVWPSAARRKDFGGVAASYTAAARDVGGWLFPVGEAWQAAWRRDPTLALYGADGFHPSQAGSYLAALVIYARLSNRPPVGLSTLSIALSSSKVLLLQEAAREVLARQLAGR